MKIALCVTALVVYVQVIMSVAEPKNRLLRGTSLASSTVMAALAIIYLIGLQK